MSKKIFTVFQNLDKAVSGNWVDQTSNNIGHNNSYDMSSNGGDIIYKADNKEDYVKTKLELQQNAYLQNRWRKANVDLSVQAYNGLNNIRLMYRDADLMDAFPEIGAALDILSEESALSSPSTGNIINVYSKSDRIKNILEDLFVNRLDIHTTAVMVIRGMCKYGNQFMMLNIDNKNGVMGWRQLPVFNVERLESGIENPYGGISLVNSNNINNDTDLSTKFIWTDEFNKQVPFRNWQIAHFRLINNSLYLPYGVSALNSARRHWRMLSVMEDLMLIYRLERSIERRVYKIFVGAIDDADVPAYIDEIANNFKRTPIIDPMTGQLDLRKNIMPVRKDTPIPLLDGRTITIEELSKEYNEGKENYVYSIQDKTLQIVPGKVVWCGKNYTAEKVVKITLDDGTYTVMAPEHEVIMRDGSKKRADELKENESIMPFYRKINKEHDKWYERYEKIYNPRSGKYERTHRLIGKELLKEKDEYNTIHHKDFNKYNNNPTNLMWCDFHEHHKMHSELAKKNWTNPEKRKSIIEKISKKAIGRLHTEETKEKISSIIKEKYRNGEMECAIKHNSKFISKYNKLESTIELRREQGKKRGYIEGFKKYNNSELHKEHDKIRRVASSKQWDGDNTERIKKMTIYFDNYIWDNIRENVLNNTLKTQNDIVKYINNNLIDYLISINNNIKLNNNRKISKILFKTRLNEIGYKNIDEYITSIKKNHKVKSIEIIDGDDVYCMTVIGLNGEEDRHNFAIRSFNEDGSWNESGIFVSNCIDNDIFIPTRSENAPTPIDTLQAGQNLTAMDDIKFVQNKVLTALRIPKTFLNFEENAGDGKNLALMDIRFTRTINRIQQAFLMELTKIATIHLYLLGFEDELTNFSLSMNNPSTQAEQLEIENLQKKISAVRDAVADPGNGIPVMSLTRALKEIMKWSDKEIQENLEEIRLEKALAAELEKTTQIIKKTGIFDTVDRVYGEPGAEYLEDQQGGEGQDPMGGGGGAPMGGGAPIGGDMGGDDLGGEVDDLGNFGADDSGDIAGNEGEIPMDNSQPNESISRFKKKILKESINNRIKSITNDSSYQRAKVFDKALMINEEFDALLKSLDEIK